MFKRRNPKTYLRMMADLVYPRGGWSRAVSYVLHRLRRLPDPPHRIARGVAVGVFVCFTPFFGLHFVLAVIFTFILQGNVIAALLATFFGNPLTFPFIAAMSLELGSLMLGIGHSVPLHEVFDAFRDAAAQLWTNIVALFTDDRTHWFSLLRFFWTVFLPYLVGGIVPGIVAGAIAYMLTRPAVSAYQKARIKRLKARYQKRHATGMKKADRSRRA